MPGGYNKQGHGEDDGWSHSCLGRSRGPLASPCMSECSTRSRFFYTYYVEKVEMRNRIEHLPLGHREAYGPSSRPTDKGEYPSFPGSMLVVPTWHGVLILKLCWCRSVYAPRLMAACNQLWIRSRLPSHMTESACNRESVPGGAKAWGDINKARKEY